MKYDKADLRKKYLLKRKKEHIKFEKFNFDPIFKLIKNHFNKRKIIIAGYYPANYEVNVLNFLKEASKKGHKIALPAVESSKNMSFKIWVFKEPLYVSKFGILEPKRSKKKIIPDLIMVPLVAFDDKLNRIGYGKGYYDRILKKVTKIKRNKIFLGIAYSFQKYNKIPIDRHDYKLDYIYTEKGIINIK